MAEERTATGPETLIRTASTMSRGTGAVRTSSRASAASWSSTGESGATAAISSTTGRRRSPTTRVYAAVVTHVPGGTRNPARSRIPRFTALPPARFSMSGSTSTRLRVSGSLRAVDRRVVTATAVPPREVGCPPTVRRGPEAVHDAFGGFRHETPRRPV